MRRISLALALFGAVAAAGCGGAGGTTPASSGGNKGIEQSSYKLVVRGEGAFIDPATSTTIILPKGGVVTATVGGIDCGVDAGGTLHKVCEALVPYNNTTAVTLTPTPNTPAYTVWGWAGACGGSGACSFFLTDTKFVGIRFAANTAGLGAHPNFTDPAIHIQEVAKQAAVPRPADAYVCTQCHGADLLGQGLAPSCATCHNPPAAASTGLQLAVVSADVDNATSTATIRFTVRDAQNNALDIKTAKAASSTTGSIVPVVMDGTIRVAIARIDTDGSQTLPYAVLTPNSGSPSTLTIPKVGVAYTTAAGGLVQNAVGDYTFTTPTLAKIATTDTAKTHTLWFQATRQVNASAFDPKGVAVVNYEYNFVPAGGTAAKREVVTSAACNKCHNGFKAEPKADGTAWASFHSGARINGAFCDVCHNPGRTSNPAADAMVFVHRVHGAEQIGLPTSLWFHGIGVTYPQAISNCAECHGGALQGDQYKTRPTRAACGSCHYAIDFAAGTGHTGGAQADDTGCYGCHNAAEIDTAHVPVLAKDTNNSLDVASGNIRTNAGAIPAVGALPAGAARIAWVIQSVSTVVDPAGATTVNPVITFKFTKDGSDVVFNTPPAAKPTTKAGIVQLMPDFVGAPSAYFVWSEPEQGITAPADFNKSGSANLLQLFNKYNALNTITGPDGSGFYTVTLGAVKIPVATAKMLTGGIGYSYDYPTQAEYAAGTIKNQPLTQTNVAGYPFDTTLGSGGLIVTAPNKKMAASGYSARRTIVSNDKCNACHGQLGVEPNFHVGQRNDGESCSWCHNPAKTSSQWSTNSTTFIHAMHGAKHRTVPYNWHAGSCPSGSTFTAYPTTTADLSQSVNNGFCWDATNAVTVTPSPYYPGVEYPGSGCTQCHVAGGFDYSANAAAVPNILWPTVATGIPAASISTSPYVTLGTNYGAAGGATNLMSSPIASVCFSCHDSAAAKTHIEAGGGKIYVARSAVGGSTLVNTETCLNCHGAGMIAPIADAHK